MTNELLKKVRDDGYNVRDENGVLMLMVSAEDWGNMKIAQRIAKKFEKYLKEIGYNASYGYRMYFTE